MNGTVGVESVPEKGSTFWVELPGTTVETFPNASATGREPGPGMEQQEHSGKEKYTVLYIEDNPSNKKLVELILARRNDVRLVTASTAARGLELAETSLPSLILLDLNLPEMDGYEVLHLLRAKDWGRDIPVVAVTASAMAHDIKRAEREGFSSYLTKPLNVSHFLEVVGGILEGMKK